jgi:hypothetical protein
MASATAHDNKAANNPNNIDSRLLRGIDELTAFGGGQYWSIREKNKALSKFGARSGLGSTNSTVAPLGGEAHETLLSTNGITSIVSSDNSDNQTYVIEYHTINGAGDELTFGVQTVTLTGQAPAPLSVPCARVSRAYNTSVTESLGDIYLFEGGSVTLGVPDTSSEIHLQIEAGDQQSKKAATSISNQDAYFITQIITSVVSGSPGSQVVDFDIEIRQLGSVWRPQLEWSCQIGALSTVFLDLDPVIIVPKNHDVRVSAETASGTGVKVTAAFRGYLASLDF